MPIAREFDALLAFAAEHRQKAMPVIVDDVRLFMPGGDPVYPPRSVLLAIADALGAVWKIENDLFICRREADGLRNS